MSRYTAVITRGGRITIPIEIRRELGLQAGDKVTITREGDHLRLTFAESVAQRTAGIVVSYRLDRVPTDEELREAFERGVSEEVVSSFERE